jgi:hypothetical protein
MRSVLTFLACERLKGSVMPSSLQRRVMYSAWRWYCHRETRTTGVREGSRARTRLQQREATHVVRKVAEADPPLDVRVAKRLVDVLEVFDVLGGLKHRRTVS